MREMDQGVHLKCCATNLIQSSGGYSLNEQAGMDRIQPSKFCTAVELRIQQRTREIIIVNLKPAAPVSGRILAALVIASVLVSSCGGGGGGSPTPSAPCVGSVPGTQTPPAPNGSNIIPVVIDAGPVSGTREINVAYVSVQVCPPGTSPPASTCQTIHHVQLDTGSSGLRLLGSQFTSTNFPQVTTTPGGPAIGECAAFVIGTTWGSVRYADIYLGGEVAKNVPFQDIGDTTWGYSTPPPDCSNMGVIQNTQASMGSNGLLGVGLFKNDCDACITAAPPIPAAYYTCASTSCTSTMVTANQVVQNPVADFAQDNNGVQINLPAVPSAGTNTILNGSLIFGIGTQTNNSLPGTASVFDTDQYGNIITTYKGTSMNGSYLDSGSNALFFNDATIATCSTNYWAYCPTPSPLALSAINTAASGSPSGTVCFSVVGLDPIGANVVAANIGGPGTNNTFDWGLSFFFGRPVFTAISGAITPAGTGPYFAY
ncbi:MAG: hypothetical protein AWT59_1864 [Candidatus Gallionella acididurans]|uniref:Uncharacterized protein n=1 Tax=Candidatus Gallionella acididurans TaxID=1796491 RepID=A0A139BSM7_9PROT|nr:MAG: hypothetical protein AWT59_1864 [Candidatus Gallionella acididurans]